MGFEGSKMNSNHFNEANIQGMIHVLHYFEKSVLMRVSRGCLVEMHLTGGKKQSGA